MHNDPSSVSRKGHNTCVRIIRLVYCNRNTVITTIIITLKYYKAYTCKYNYKNTTNFKVL